MKSIGLAMTMVLFGLVAGCQQTKRGASSQITLKGQVVCSGCWDEADRAKVAYGTKDDLACAETCASNGVKAALAVGKAGTFELYILEDGDFQRKESNWLPYMAKTVQITGRASGAAGARHIKVDALLPEPVQ